MFTKSAAFYDLIYASKDYAAESAIIHELLNTHRHRVGNSLLDVACGTGKHLVQLKHYYLVEGIDLDEGGVLSIARRRLPDVPFHVGDMVDFDLGRTFDMITCLFSSVGYARTLPRMKAAIANMAKHLAKGGVMIVEPWFGPGGFIPGKPTARFVDEPDIKISRMNVGSVENGISVLDFHYMVATTSGIDTFHERHELGMFSQEQYRDAFAAVGLEVEHDPKGLGRGLYIAVKK
jgi:ubiquinone/menaquinone biosynthesis C-methylase UbiE